MWKRIRRRIVALHRDEQGADMVEYILVIAAVALPLLAIVIWFWKDISSWASNLWDSAKRQEGADPHDLD